MAQRLMVEEHERYGRKSRNWVFTDFELLDWESIYDDGKLRYVCYGEEICPSTGRKHLQGYLQTVKDVRIGSLKKIVGSKSIHLEIRKKCELANERYCSKSGKEVVMLGKYIKQGQRLDLEAVVEEIKNGKRIRDVMMDHSELYCRYRGGLKDIAEDVCRSNSKKWRDVKVEVIWGPAGTGKTRYAMDRDDVFKINGSGLQWFDGYSGESNLVIDEFIGQCDINYLKDLLDGYQCRLAVKGGFTYANWSNVFITSNVCVEKWYAGENKYNLGALYRRLSVVRFLDKKAVEDKKPLYVVDSDSSSDVDSEVCWKDADGKLVSNLGHDSDGSESGDDWIVPMDVCGAECGDDVYRRSMVR